MFALRITPQQSKKARITHIHPGDALGGVLGLLLLENQLNKQLLQLFIAVVDAKLLKSSTV